MNQQEKPKKRKFDKNTYSSFMAGFVKVEDEFVEAEFVLRRLFVANPGLLPLPVEFELPSS